MTLLEIRNLRTYLGTPSGSARAVDGVDLSLREGESIGIVGESGSGKSLLALSVLGLLPTGVGRIQDGSSVRFRGRELVGAGEGAWRRVRGREVAMVFQEPMTSLNPVFTVGNQIREVLSQHRGLEGRAAASETARLLREVGIPEAELRMRWYPHQLSGGMRQRAMIAMALAGEPALLIADEPTTALDLTLQTQILALLKKLQADRGMAMILISHDLRVVARVCETVYVMYAGRMVERGPAAELFKNPKHPYTRGLLGSRLSIRDRRSHLRPIPGEVPDAVTWPEGCRFRPRCPEAAQVCHGEPELTVLEAAGPNGSTSSRESVEGVGEDREWAARCWFPAGPDGGGP